MKLNEKWGVYGKLYEERAVMMMMTTMMVVVLMLWKESISLPGETWRSYICVCVSIVA